MLSRTKILHKLLGVIGLIGIIIGGCVWYVQSQMSQINESYSGFLANEAKAVASIRRLNRGVYEVSYWTMRSIAERDPSKLKLAGEGFETGATAIPGVVDDLRKQAPTFAKAIDEQVAVINQYLAGVSEAHALATANLQGDALALVHAKLDPIFDEVIKKNVDLLKTIQNYVERSSTELSERTNAARASLISLTVAGLLAGMAAAVLVTIFGITRPLARLVGALQRMAKGEAETDLPEARRGDEIGAVGRSVEAIKEMVARKAADEADRKRIEDAAAAAERRRTMMEMADGFEDAVGGIISMVSSSATELQATAQTMTATAAETASQSTTVAAAAEEAASNVSTVAAASEELGSSVQEIGRQVNSSARLAQTAVSEAVQTAGLVQELSGAVAKIGDVVTMISTIAGQTNLLALNATIEAARAGEAGRGFAVVATEVKELASQTARATEEISSQIARIQGSTGQAVQAIGSISARIQEISGVATAIAAAVEEQGAATQEIVRNVAQAAMGTGEVTSNIAGVAGAAEETGAAASQVLGAAGELSRQSEHLSAEVWRFLATVRAA